MQEKDPNRRPTLRALLACFALKASQFALPAAFLRELEDEAKDPAHADDPNFELNFDAPREGVARWIAYLPWADDGKGGLLIAEGQRILRAQHLRGPFFFVEPGTDEAPAGEGQEAAKPGSMGAIELDNAQPTADDADPDTGGPLILDRYGNEPGDAPDGLVNC